MTCVVDSFIRSPLYYYVDSLRPHDIDLATPALPEQVIEVLTTAGLRVIETGLKHGTVTAVVDGEQFEITTLRVDTDPDGRHCTVEYTHDWRLDAERRDLTFNAMSMGLDGNQTPFPELSFLDMQEEACF